MSKQQTFDKVDLLGVSIDIVDMVGAITYICNYAADHSKPAAYVIKPYVEFLDRAATKPELQALLGNAELSIADGVAVLWAAHYLYAGPRSFSRFWLNLAQIILAPDNLTWPVTERAAGTTFTWPLLRAAADRHLKIFVIGKETRAEIDLVARVITSEIPGIQVVGSLSGRDPRSAKGSVSEAWLTQVAQAIQSSGADLVFIGMGFPLQEQVAARLAGEVGHGVLIGEGGTFDYESFGGTRRKAPEVMSKLGLEWLWRLILEPRRIIRQLAIPRFIYRIWQSR